MGDGRAIRRLAFCALGIQMNPLMISGGVCELLNLFLGDGVPAAHTELLAFTALQSVGVVYDERRHESLLKLRSVRGRCGTRALRISQVLRPILQARAWRWLPHALRRGRPPSARCARSPMRRPGRYPAKRLRLRAPEWRDPERAAQHLARRL